MDMAGVLTAQLLLLLVMLLTLGLAAWSVSRVDGAWNDDISSCKSELTGTTHLVISSKAQYKFTMSNANMSSGRRKVSELIGTCRRLCGEAGEVGERSGWPKGSWLGAGGSRRFRRLTESRLAQWPHRTATVV
jgi:hypothetical protein